jgi:PKHD-type hydroxylase
VSAVLRNDAAEGAAVPRHAFALGLGELAPELGARRRFASLDSVSETQLVTTPQVMLGLFSPEECARIAAHGDSRQLHPGQVTQERENYRRASAAWLRPDADTLWVYQRITAMIAKLNAWYRYDLYGFLEPLHFVRYDTGGKFDWHLDCGGDMTCTRKLSVTIQLSDPATYEGGGLEFCPQGELHRSRYHGAATVFPSTLAHRVTPVERGVRRALVAWIHGPSFR